MGPLIANSQTQLLWSRSGIGSGIGYHSELSLTVANEGAHVPGTLEKHPHLGGQSPPSENLVLIRGLYLFLIYTRTHTHTHTHTHTNTLTHKQTHTHTHIHTHLGPRGAAKAQHRTKSRQQCTQGRLPLDVPLLSLLVVVVVCQREAGPGGGAGAKAHLHCLSHSYCCYCCRCYHCRCPRQRTCLLCQKLLRKRQWVKCTWCWCPGKGEEFCMCAARPHQTRIS